MAPPLPAPLAAAGGTRRRQHAAWFAAELAALDALDRRRASLRAEVVKWRAHVRTVKALQADLTSADQAAEAGATALLAAAAASPAAARGEQEARPAEEAGRRPPRLMARAIAGAELPAALVGAGRPVLVVLMEPAAAAEAAALLADGSDAVVAFENHLADGTTPKAGWGASSLSLTNKHGKPSHAAAAGPEHVQPPTKASTPGALAGVPGMAGLASQVDQQPPPPPPQQPQQPPPPQPAGPQRHRRVCPSVASALSAMDGARSHHHAEAPRVRLAGFGNLTAAVDYCCSEAAATSGMAELLVVVCSDADAGAAAAGAVAAGAGWTAAGSLLYQLLQSDLVELELPDNGDDGIRTRDALGAVVRAAAGPALPTYRLPPPTHSHTHTHAHTHAHRPGPRSPTRSFPRRPSLATERLAACVFGSILPEPSL